MRSGVLIFQTRFSLTLLVKGGGDVVIIEARRDPRLPSRQGRGDGASCEAQRESRLTYRQGGSMLLAYNCSVEILVTPNEKLVH